MPQTLRSSGIPFLDDVPWGSHLCVFYETRDDLVDAAARYFEQGLDNNELCVWALPASLTADEVIAGCKGRLAAFKMPKAVEFVTEVPRNPSGKILK